MYTTQMDAARKGIITDEMRTVARKEGVSAEKIRELVACGRVVIPANRNHKGLDPAGIGEGLRTKINVNIGISRDCRNFDIELEKARTAIDLKTDSIMDLSSYGKTHEFRKKLIEMSPVMIGTVPVYDVTGFYNKELDKISADEFFNVVEQHAKDGVDFMTVHAGINRETARRFKQNQRLTNIVSRGGALLFAWMELTGRENPFYEQFDRLLEICEKYDVTISLGDALRPGSINDSTDAAQIHELIVLGELTRRAWERNVQVMIEGPGHMAMNEIAANVVLEKSFAMVRRFTSLARWSLI